MSPQGEKPSLMSEPSSKENRHQKRAITTRTPHALASRFMKKPVFMSETPMRPNWVLLRCSQRPRCWTYITWYYPPRDLYLRYETMDYAPLYYLSVGSVAARPVQIIGYTHFPGPDTEKRHEQAQEWAESFLRKEAVRRL